MDGHGAYSVSTSSIDLDIDLDTVLDIYIANMSKTNIAEEQELQANQDTNTL